MTMSGWALRGMFTMFLATFWVSPGASASLDEIRDSGTLRHLGIRYANFVTGAGDGFDVELMQGFAAHIGVRHELVYTDFYSVIKDLLGQDVVLDEGEVRLTGSFPVRGDVISTGFTILPWRQEVLLYSDPTFPSQVLLIAPSGSDVSPIQPTGDIDSDIAATKAQIGSRSLLVMERTCLDPAGYGLTGQGLDLQRYTNSTNLNEMVPAMLQGSADLTLLDVPDILLDLVHWPGQLKIIGPISTPQALATAFPPGSEDLRDAFNAYLGELKADGRYDALVDTYYPGSRSFFPEFF